MTAQTPLVGAVASWFGSNRILGPKVGEALRGCLFVAIPFAGGMCEVPHIGARTLVLNDIHPHLMNLASVMADPTLGPRLYRELRRVPFSPNALATAQNYCRAWEENRQGGIFASDFQESKLSWAIHYFVASWMSRHGSAGTKGEFKAPLSIRYDGGGGDSATHYWNAVKSIVTWRRILHRATFTCLDFREFLAKIKDAEGVGIYCDSPFPDAGDGYKYAFTMKDFQDLARLLTSYRNARIVIRYYDHPLIRELYPQSDWHWQFLTGRKQTNDSAPEVLMGRGVV